MTATDQRATRRDRILLLARMRVEGEAESCGIRIRDLSAGGMRAQFAGRALQNLRVAIEIRNLGWVEGRVAWQGAEHIGVRFDTPIDPEKARIAVTGGYLAPAPAGVGQRRL